MSSGGTGRGLEGTGGGGSDREGGKGASVRELFFTSRVGEHSSALSRALIDGKPMDVEVILPRMRLRLTGAVVSSYTTSGSDGNPTEAWTLNFESLEQSAEGGE